MPDRVAPCGETWYRTIDLARQAGVHPNTVRLYEEWGFLAPAGRGANNYRRWTSDHLDQMIFARRALHGSWPGRRIRTSALTLVRTAAGGDLEAALELAREHTELVRDEIARAEEAAAFLEEWAAAPDDYPDDLSLGPGEAASAVGASRDQIRNWERNRLIHTPRDPSTGYRVYGRRELGRLRIIRTLVLAGYSLMAILRMIRGLDGGSAAGLRELLDTPAPGEEIMSAFDTWLTSLAAQEWRAVELEAQLSGRIARRDSGVSVG